MTTVYDNIGLNTPGPAEWRLSDLYLNDLLLGDSDAQKNAHFALVYLQKLTVTKSDTVKHSTRLISSEVSSRAKMK